MTDFNSWEQVKEWLEQDEAVVVSGTWYFTKHFMSCGNYTDEYGACCSDSFKDVDDCLESIKNLADDKLENVEEE